MGGIRGFSMRRALRIDASDGFAEFPHKGISAIRSQPSAGHYAAGMVQFRLQDPAAVHQEIGGARLRVHALVHDCFHPLVVMGQTGLLERLQKLHEAIAFQFGHIAATN
jgi:hypothetical protein